MKRVNKLLIAGLLAGLPLWVSAGTHQPQPAVNAADQPCYLAQQRGSSFCRLVMFPPIPFR